jgi:arginase family enzyme
MLDAYFEPIKLHELYGSDPFPTDALGSTIAAYTKENNLPAFEGAQIAIIGIGEDRGSVDNQGCGEGVDAIRNKFYLLKCHSKSLRIIDLGNLKVGYSIEDTYAAIATVISELIPLNVIPILIGGSQDLTYGQYLGYKKVEKIINIVSVDSRFDLGKPDQEMNSVSFLGKIIMEQPNYLFNFSNLGYQTYFVGNESVELMNKLYFDTHRLGQIRTDIEDAEPIVRNADLITVDISSIRQCDAPGNRNSSPNGFYGEEICQIMMYAGISDKLSGLGIYEYNSLLDREGQTAHLIAQMMWYFLEGIGNRKADIPANNPEGYITYRVPMTNIDQEITFLKSIKSNRWWMKLPVELAKNRFMSHHLIPCSYKDYQQACKSEVPDKWWNAIQKLS